MSVHPRILTINVEEDQVDCACLMKLELLDGHTLVNSVSSCFGGLSVQCPSDSRAF